MTQTANDMPPPVVKAKLNRRGEPYWFFLVRRHGGYKFCRFGFDTWYPPESLIVEPHELNDADAVAIIEQANAGRNRQRAKSSRTN